MRRVGVIIVELEPLYRGNIVEHHVVAGREGTCGNGFDAALYLVVQANLWEVVQVEDDLCPVEKSWLRKLASLLATTTSGMTYVSDAQEKKFAAHCSSAVTASAMSGE